MKRFIKRLPFSLGAGILALPPLAWLVSELLVLHEMHVTGAFTQADLSEDYGLGFLMMFAWPLLTLVAAVLVMVCAWFWSARIFRATPPHSPQQG